jgi:hypothetical protein
MGIEAPLPRARNEPPSALTFRGCQRKE